MRNKHGKLKHKVHCRDGYTCKLKIHPNCKGDMSQAYAKYLAKQLTRKKVGLSVDHKIPLSRGGKWELTNLVTACVPCNCLKGNKTLQEIEHLLME